MQTWKLFAGGLAFFIVGCSQAGDDARQAQSQDEGLATSPNVSPTGAPGVAFRYAYFFELPDEKIAAVQETHAARCEAMGVSRCRITGLQYRVEDSDAVYGRLQVKLAPGIARQFGKEAVTDVRQANGRLTNTEFTGEDTEPTTTAATSRQSDLQTRIADVEKQLAQATAGAERAQLQTQLNELRSQAAEARETIAGAQQLLAGTPMTFNYYGRGGISGFRSNPVHEAARSFVSSLVMMITVVLQVLAVAFPWAILLALIIVALRSRPGRAITRYFSRKSSYQESGE